jgi:NAD(P)-dependent dehydrogenase (short-subunit alcohol dehydrogenase family)
MTAGGTFRVMGPIGSQVVVIAGGAGGIGAELARTRFAGLIKVNVLGVYHTVRAALPVHRFALDLLARMDAEAAALGRLLTARLGTLHKPFRRNHSLRSQVHTGTARPAFT